MSDQYYRRRAEASTTFDAKGYVDAYLEQQLAEGNTEEYDRIMKSRVLADEKERKWNEAQRKKEQTVWKKVKRAIKKFFGS